MHITQSISSSWGPEQRRAALSLTFDNFGEAADIEFGQWPQDAPIGAHYTALDVLPKLLDDLDGARATFFVEGWNAGVYPDQLRSIADAGHEVALHGWRHEIWERLDAEQQSAHLSRSLDALRSIGLTVSGFRPPGGTMPAGGTQLLAERGLRYYSPAATGGRADDEAIACLPFEWRLVDGFHLEPKMEAHRVELGGTPGHFTPSHWAGILNEALNDAIRNHDHMVVVCHPFLFGKQPEQRQVLADFIRTAKRHPDVWVAPCADIAGWMAGAASQPESFTQET